VTAEITIEQALDTIASSSSHGSTKVTETALNGLASFARRSREVEARRLAEELTRYGDQFIRLRPTSILLVHAVKSLIRVVRDRVEQGQDVEGVRHAILEQKDVLLRSIRSSIEQISSIGSRRISDGESIMIHGYSSTALGIIKRAAQEGKRLRIFSTETRPEFEGRLAAIELSGLGIDTTIITDSSSRYYMKDVDKFLVGAEAVAANGAVINKIGTSLIALAAHEARVRVFVAAATSKFSSETVLGELVAIEERDRFQLLSPSEYEKLGRPRIRNPAYDVTSPEHVDLIITEKGVIPPQGAIMILRESFGWPISGVEDRPLVGVQR
jgi:ribose 1,5-bisphosphate isomerase